MRGARRLRGPRGLRAPRGFRGLREAFSNDGTTPWRMRGHLVPCSCSRAPHAASSLHRAAPCVTSGCFQRAPSPPEARPAQPPWYPPATKPVPGEATRYAHSRPDPESSTGTGRDPAVVATMAVQAHGIEFVLAQTPPRAKPPQSLRDRADRTGKASPRRHIQRPQHKCPIGPDGSSLFADATEVVGLHIGNRPRRGPLSEHFLEASGEKPESQSPRRAAVCDGVEDFICHRHQ